MASRLREIFSSADLLSGQVTWYQFEGQLHKMESFFKSVDVDVSEAKGLFHLLDIEGTGTVDVDDFIMGCLRLRGAAKAIDLATLMSETRRLRREWRMHMETFQELMRSRLPTSSTQRLQGQS